MLAKSSAQWSWEASGDHTGDMSMRHTTFVPVDLVIGGGAYYSSYRVDVDSNSTAANTDSVWGGITAFPGSFPQASLTYFEAKADTIFRVDNGRLVLDASASQGLLGTAFVKMEEVRGSEVLQTIDLSDGTILWDIQTMDVGSDSLFGLKVTGSKMLQSWSFAASFMVSTQAGALRLGSLQADLVPLGIESVVEIADFPYQDSVEGQVRLTMGTASGEVNVDGNASFEVEDASGAVTTMSFAGNALVDGTELSVDVSGFVSADWQHTFGDGFVKAAADVLYGASAEVRTTSVTFPKGAQDIVYDPAMAAQSSSATGLSLGLLSGVGLVVSAVCTWAV